MPPRMVYTRSISTSIRVGDVELTPGYTSYAKILHVQTYDVLDLLRAGANTIDVVLSDGWYRGQVGAFRQINQYGDRVAFLAQLELGFDDGSRQIVATGDDWVARTGAVLAADLMQGVRIDFRLKDDTPARQEHSPWAPVRVADHDLTRLRASPSPPVRRIDEIAPADIHALDSQPADHRPGPEHRRLAEAHRSGARAVRNCD